VGRKSFFPEDEFYRLGCNRTEEVPEEFYRTKDILRSRKAAQSGEGNSVYNHREDGNARAFQFLSGFSVDKLWITLQSSWKTKHGVSDRAC
jgi:hypothetical protein